MGINGCKFIIQSVVVAFNSTAKVNTLATIIFIILKCTLINSMVDVVVPASFSVTMEMKMLYVCLKICEVNLYTDNMELQC